MTPQVTALNINSSPVIIASIAATTEDGLAAAATVTQDVIQPALLGILTALRKCALPMALHLV